MGWCAARASEQGAERSRPAHSSWSREAPTASTRRRQLRGGSAPSSALRSARRPPSGAQKAAVMSSEVAACAVTKRKARRSEMYLHIVGRAGMAGMVSRE